MRYIFNQAQDFKYIALLCLPAVRIPHSTYLSTYKEIPSFKMLKYTLPKHFQDQNVRNPCVTPPFKLKL